MKIHLEIIKEIREAVGEDFTILLRLGASDYMEGGLTIEESKIAAHKFEKAGVDILDISGGLCRYMIPGVNEQGYFSPLSNAIKEVVKIPVIVTGGITEVETAEKILSEGKADLIGVGRAIYRDSN
jgi:2,4-dienoyl-CoA reductase-like NADH-dependent reductase (Old Yellow Enzyme family)